MKKNISIKTKRRLLLLATLSLILTGYLGYNVKCYLKKINNNYSERDKLETKLNGLMEEEDSLRVEINKLEDPDYVAKFAREKFLYSKDGELIFRIIK